MRPVRPRRFSRPPRGLPLRAIAPNAVTALALCSGLSGVRFAISGEWEKAVAMIMVAGVLDGIDGRIARLLRGESRFGAELDSLSDAISFGVAPALILYLWTLSALPRVGWISALLLAVFCALRLARFNAQIDETVQPHKSAGFLTGVPAPAGAGLALLPMFLWFWTDEPLLASPYLVAPWAVFVAVLMVSSVATFSWSSLRLRRSIRFEALAVIVLLGAALINVPWHTLSVIAILYLATIPFSIAAYARVRRPRAVGGSGPE
ncbi:CDP-alcohol phosphatidyltransferase family protein [Sphingomonas metalli]|uniref:CDP-alcohol phosphatidyltransferase family protein n=1 Tax=Sphingomonas metalli TaxID=1779358 RepID=UPI001E605A7D|nr:phosphatidylcholine/phosphatidylserine synthase [Sphingomonas metalli]